jgi:hypothetical protein
MRILPLVLLLPLVQSEGAEIYFRRIDLEPLRGPGRSESTRLK